MIPSNTIIFACIIVKADAFLVVDSDEDARELSAIENSLHNLRSCSQLLDNENVPEFCHTRQSSNELSRKSRSFLELKVKDEQCMKSPCSRKSHKIIAKVILSPHSFFEKFIFEF